LCDASGGLGCNTIVGAAQISVMCLGCIKTMILCSKYVLGSFFGGALATLRHMCRLITISYQPLGGMAEHYSPGSALAVGVFRAGIRWLVQSILAACCSKWCVHA
jgi:hypothetical protein